MENAEDGKEKGRPVTGGTKHSGLLPHLAAPKATKGTLPGGQKGIGRRVASSEPSGVGAAVGVWKMEENEQEQE